MTTQKHLLDTSGNLPVVVTTGSRPEQAQSIKKNIDWREEAVPNSPQLFVFDSYCESQFF